MQKEYCPQCLKAPLTPITVTCTPDVMLALEAKQKTLRVTPMTQVCWEKESLHLHPQWPTIALAEPEPSCWSLDVSSSTPRGDASAPANRSQSWTPSIHFIRETVSGRRLGPRGSPESCQDARRLCAPSLRRLLPTSLFPARRTVAGPGRQYPPAFPRKPPDWVHCLSFSWQTGTSIRLQSGQARWRCGWRWPKVRLVNVESKRNSAMCTLEDRDRDM